MSATSLARRTPSRFARNRLALIGAALVLIVVGASALAPWIAPHDPSDIDMGARYAAPLQGGYWLGADDLGRDTLSRLLFAGRVSITVGLTAMVVTIVVGFLVGAFAAYQGGWLEVALMRLTDMVLCFPKIFLLLFVAAFVSPGLVTVALMIGLTCWMEISRIVHALILSLKQRDYIHAARLSGMRTGRIVLRQILPNMLAPVLVAATLNMAEAILLESYVSFLGYGIQPPEASWGNMLTNAQSDFQIDPWLAIFPGLAITLTVTSFNFIGDGLRDALDVRRL
jgi:peptide/nickel transport system permease protein